MRQSASLQIELLHDNAWQTLPSFLLGANLHHQLLSKTPIPFLLRGNAPSSMQHSTLLVLGTTIFSAHYSRYYREILFCFVLTAKTMGHSVHAHPTSSCIAVGGYERRSSLPSSTLRSICVGLSHELDPAAFVVTQPTTPKTTVIDDLFAAALSSDYSGWLPSHQPLLHVFDACPPF